VRTFGKWVAKSLVTDLPETPFLQERLVNQNAAMLAEIAARFGVTRERVHEIEERLKQRLRRYLQATLGDAVPMTTTANA
jgi:DNA-directed RNA polymerase sigma subunit (sigma70/sigma32)